MKKNLILTALFLGISITSFAQADDTEGNSVLNSENSNIINDDRSFWSNTFVSAGFGGQILLGDHETQMRIRDMISPALQVAAGKWFTPVVALRLMYTGWSLNGATQDAALGNGKPIPNKPWHGYWLYEQEIKYMSLSAEAMFNLSNVFFGYDKNHAWAFCPYIGLGWLHASKRKVTNEIGMNVGLHNAFRITDALDFTLDLRGSMVDDGFDAEIGGRGLQFLMSAAIGFAYNIKPVVWKKNSKNVIDETK